MIYLDHAATTPPAPEALDTMLECAREVWTNPSAAYTAAGDARGRLRRARATIAEMLGCDAQEIVFDSSGTEGNALALSMAEGGHVVLSALEHRSVFAAAERWGCRVTRVAPDAAGRITADAVGAAIRPETKLISVQFANNETGVIHDIEGIGKAARASRVPFHCDAVQAFGHVPIDARRCGIDLLTLSAHKFYGPAGVGAVYIRQGLSIKPLLAGHQEFGLRAGTENVPGICGMAEAARLARADMAARDRRERELLAGFTGRLLRDTPEARLIGGGERLPNIAAVLLPGLPSEVAVAKLDTLGVAVSGGAACASGERGPSHVFRAMGLADADALCVLRVSVGRSTTEADLATAAELVERVWRDGRG